MPEVAFVDGEFAIDFQRPVRPRPSRAEMLFLPVQGQVACDRVALSVLSTFVLTNFAFGFVFTR